MRFFQNKYNLFQAFSLLLVCVIMLYPNVAYIVNRGFEASYVLTSVLYCLPLLGILLFIRRRWLYCVLVTLLTIGSIIDLTMVDLYGDYLLPGAIISTIKTNTQEASEFFHTNLMESLHWIPLIVLCVAACVCYRGSNMRLRLKCAALAVSLLIPSLFVAYKLIFYYSEDTRTLRLFVDTRIWNRTPYNVTFQLINAKKTLDKRHLIDDAQHLDMGAHRSLVPQQKEVYVFCIGESLRYDNLSLNGKYHRSTTPHLEQEQNILLFDNYYSQACLTMFSVPMLITRATPQNFELNYAERSIIEPFRECGFKTFTIANNSNLLSYETYLSLGTDSLYIVPDVREGETVPSGDRNMVRLLDSLVAQHDKLFVMMQFKGNHSFFTNYEPQFAKYLPDANSCDPLHNRDSLMLINAYDNTILYTDYILSSIIGVINQPNVVSTMLFVSDHGECIGQGGAGHGGNCSPSMPEYHVPLIFWWSDAYAATFGKKLESASPRKTAKLNGDVVYYSLCDMADIALDSAYAMPSWSVFSPTFREHPRYVLVPDGVTYVEVE